jgi:5'-3' exoribonuclease 2
LFLGIIHPCCHPEDSDQPDDENEMIQRIFKYIDRIFAMVRPRKLLFMAIDGVAPRAKMNRTQNNKNKHRHIQIKNWQHCTKFDF